MAQTRIRSRRQAIRLAVQLLMLIVFPATFYYFSPVVCMQGASLGIVSGSLVLFALLLLTSVVIGRLFCSWLCPAGAIGDLAGPARPRPVGSIRWVKYLVWTPWLVTIVLLFTGAGGVKGVDIAFGTVSGLSVSSVESVVAYLIVAAVFLALSLSVGRRASCHTICWLAPDAPLTGLDANRGLAPFMVLGRATGNALRVPAVRLASDPSLCRHCGRCTAGCPMSLPVQAMVERRSMEHVDCILCGECADACPGRAIRFTFRKPVSPKAAAAVAAAMTIITGCTTPLWTPPSYEPDAQVTVDDSFAAELQSVLDVAVNANEMPGIQAALIMPDGGEWIGAAGTTDYSRAEPLGTDSLLRIASITKLYTATVALRLVEAGRLSLDDGLDDWLPHYPRADEITVEMLLRHTSGLPDTFEQFSTLLRSALCPRYVWTHEELVARHDGPLHFDPGTDFRYSNANYMFLGIIAERLTGVPFARLLRATVLEPHGLLDTYLAPDEPVPDRLVSGFDRDLMPFPSEHRPDQTSWSSLAFASGGMVATAMDVARFTQALFTGRIVSPSTLERMLELGPTHDAGEGWTGYGLGVVQCVIDGETYRGHEGLFIGFAGTTLYSPGLGFSVTVLGNVSRFRVTEVVAAMSRVVRERLEGAT